MNELAQALDSALSKLRRDLDPTDRLEAMELRISGMEGEITSLRPTGAEYAPAASVESAPSICDLSPGALRAHRRA